jgi:hypothetical protein
MLYVPGVCRTLVRHGTYSMPYEPSDTDTGQVEGEKVVSSRRHQTEGIGAVGRQQTVANGGSHHPQTAFIGDGAAAYPGRAAHARETRRRQ